MTVSGQDLKVAIDKSTGAISSICDTTGMDWIIRTDGSQYSNIGKDLSWGLGYFSLGGQKYNWETPICEGEYEVGGVSVKVGREFFNEMFTETYSFTNLTDSTIFLSDIGICTPFNDNYPDSRTCMTSRCHAHIWAGGNSAYICALRMGAVEPHLGLVVTKGSVSNYDILQRTNGHKRGVIALCPDNMRLEPGEKSDISWKVFLHRGKDDFKKIATGLGCKILSSESYLASPLSKVSVKSYDGKKCKISIPDTTGDFRAVIHYKGDRKTYVDFLVLPDKMDLISARMKFIVENQQMNNRSDLRYGAFMVYDCQGDSIFLNDRPSCSPLDRDEGAERLGMGVALARYCLVTNRTDYIDALIRYASFVRNGLQEKDYTTYSTVDHKARNRGYNYPWVAEFQFLMYLLTDEKQYAIDGYRTLKTSFRYFPHFYFIGLPVLLSHHCLVKAGMHAEWESLFQDYKKLADTYISNGLDYPKFEVSYEQSIVAPVLQVIGQMYLLTKDDRYLSVMISHMPILEAFNGFQPSVHLNDISIRHWDGFWFGKLQTFGDVFPHHWSAATASAFNLFWMCTGDESYKERARNIVDNNLCQFFLNGKASCAYLYPRMVDGKRCQFYDPYANDQDWAISYYLQVYYGIWPN